MPASLPYPHRRALTACDFEGNPDIYGFGIRLDIYLQWIAAVLVKYVVRRPEVIRDVISVDTMFLFSITVATILLAFNSSTVHSVELLILLHIFSGDVYTVIFDVNTLLGRKLFWNCLGTLHPHHMYGYHGGNRRLVLVLWVGKDSEDRFL